MLEEMADARAWTGKAQDESGISSVTEGKE